MAIEKEQIQGFLGIESSELKDFIDSIDAEVLVTARELILQAEQNHNRVHVTGISKPGHVAEYAASLLSFTGTPTYELRGMEVIHGSTGQTPNGDVVIAISNSGKTTELEATVGTLKSNGVKLTAVTGKADSRLAKQGDIALTASVNQERDAMNKPSRAFILVEMVMLQGLSILLQNAKNLTPQQYVKWYLGGSLGASIKGSGGRQTRLEGIITLVVTPFHRDAQQSTNYEATQQLIDHLIIKGIKGIFILGSNGELHVIEKAEKMEFAGKVIQMVNHRTPVYVRIGACSVKETIRLSKKMEELDADTLSAITSYFLTSAIEELVQHFTAVAGSINTSITLYNIPRATGCNLSTEVVGCLTKVKNIYGIEDNSGKEENPKAYAEIAKRDDFDLLIGSDSKISYSYAVGVSGAVTGTSNVTTEVLVGLDKVLRNRETEKAKKLQEDIDMLHGILKLGAVPVVMKCAAELAGIIEIGSTRKPVLGCNAQDNEKIKEVLQYYHLI